MLSKLVFRLDKKAWWILPTLLFLASQLVVTILLVTHKDEQVAFPAQDGDQYFVKYQKPDPAWPDFISQWNGFAFKEIAVNGYPEELPYRADGRPAPSPWAFFPLFPFVCKILMLTGLSFGWAGMLVSLSCGWAGMLVLYSWLKHYTKNLWLPLLSVTSLSFAPAASLFQVTYSEGLAFLLVVSTLRLVTSKRYLPAIILVLLLGLTRPVGVPDFIVFGLHGFVLARAYLKASELSLVEVLSDTKGLLKNTWKYFALLAASGAAAVMWPLIGIIVTGQNAYFIAREGYDSPRFLPWFLNEPFEPRPGYPIGHWIFIVMFVVWGLYLAFSRAMRNLPDVLRMWPLVFALYIFATTQPIGNEWRYLMLGLFTWPFAEPPKNPVRRRWFFVALTLSFMVAFYLQYLWITVHWIDTGNLRKNV